MSKTNEHRGADIARLRSLSCAKWTRYDDDVLPAWVADMDLAPAPVSVDAVRDIAERGDFGYQMGDTTHVVEAFAAWQERRHGWRPDIAHSRVFCDVMQAVEVALWLHVKPGDGVVLFTPVYPPFYGSVKSCGCEVRECTMDAEDGWRLDPERLAAAIDERTRVILMCNPHNPSGRCFSAEELAAIADVAERHDLLVISDEIWGDLTHPGVRHIPFASLSQDAASRTVTITAASKAFNLAGLRCACAHIGDQGVYKAIGQLPSHVFGAVSSPGAAATLAAWTHGESWLDETRTFLTARRDQVAARLARDLPEVRWSVPEATYLAWLDFRPLGMAGEPATVLLDDGRVALSPGTDFGAAGTGFVRLNFATSQTLLDELFDRIVRVCR